MKLRLLLVCLLLSVCGWDKADAHLGPSRVCFNIQGYNKIGADQTIESNGLLAETYDTDGDGHIDLMTLSHEIDHKSHQEFPLFYIIDHNKDGNPDAIYIDKVGEGKCDDIVLYQDLTKPHDTGLNFGHPQEHMGRGI